MVSKTPLYLAKSLFIQTLGCVIMAWGYNFFLIPYKIVAGGWSGIGTILFHLYYVPVGMTVLILSIPLYLVSWKLLGRDSVLKSLFSTVCFSVFLDVFAPLPPLLSDDMLLLSLFGGIVIGVGLGLVFWEGASTGGSALFARVLHVLGLPISLGNLLLIIDGTITLASMLVFKDYTLGLYATVAIVATTKVVDVFMGGLNYAKAIYIISSRPLIIADRILTELGRGVTSLEGQGLFTKTSRKILLCVARRRDISRLRAIVKEEDPNAFMFLSNVMEVLGEGFTSP